MILTENLWFRYGEKDILKGVDFKAEKGVVTVLMGKNGAGKTTLLEHFNGLLRPYEGYVSVDGERLKYDRKSLLKVRRKVFYVFQNPDDQILSPTVWQEVAFGPKNLGIDGEELEKVVREALEAVGLNGYERRLCSTLSGGEKRRLTIASALAMNTEYVIMDEPSANVDGYGFDMIVELVRMLKKEGKGVVISTHDLDLAKAVGDKFYFMESGRIVWEGERLSWNMARKLGIRTFPCGRIVLSSFPEDGFDFVGVVGDGEKGKDVVEKAILRAIEGNKVLLICEDGCMQDVAKVVMRYPVEVEVRGGKDGKVHKN
ncbi:MAG: ATP-binding cassette domain-containing protein [Archaeoglobus sp.]|uniref:energy-coupling factor ABC transporter ATP-binding protein n=1 Tax=Archaeoglobus sp. TaxID=1872626 RepID=UPI001DF4E205|nr:ATP-binding cassette domain-containing protein [Archaeoglobus sp.]MBO8179285.1 ATP-binding cassette domain-containing protein [Archaeoglobus sp.]